MNDTMIDAFVIDTVLITRMMPELTDKQVCKIYKKTVWKSELWESAVEELRKRSIHPRQIKQILA